MTTAKNVLHVAQHVKYVGQKEKIMSEPRLEDDIAFFGAERCDECGERHEEPDCVVAGDPDRMYGDED